MFCISWFISFNALPNLLRNATDRPVIALQCFMLGRTNSTLTLNDDRNVIDGRQ